MRKQNEHKEAVRNYKDSIFRMIFSDKKELLALYNALNGSAYKNPDALVIKTLENVIYMNIKNDLSFLLHDGLYLYEHQSTFNPNMPIRDLLYIADQIQELLRMEDLYKSTQVKIPTPEFVTFYNGQQKQPEIRQLKLSDLFVKKVETPALELIVTQINLSTGCNKELLKKCRTLHDYVMYVDKVREYSKQGTLDEAVEQAVTECIKDDILKEFLLRQRSEAVKMTIYEFDQEQHDQTLHEEGYEYGYAEGRKEGRMESVYEFVQEGFVRVEDAATCLHMSVEDVEADMQQKGYEIPTC